MTINELRDIIRKYGYVDDVYFSSEHYPDCRRVSIGGCKLLEHVVDVEGFVSLLGEFRRGSAFEISFVGCYVDPVAALLHCGGIKFTIYNGCVYIYDPPRCCSFMWTTQKYRNIYEGDCLEDTRST